MVKHSPGRLRTIIMCFTKLIITFYASWPVCKGQAEHKSNGTVTDYERATMVTMKHLVVAYDQQRGIGADNDLLWQRNLPADLKHFKSLTTGQSIVMGRKTYESIGRPLPDRQNIVVSHSLSDIPGVTVVDSLAAAYAVAKHAVYIIGGGSIYEQALPDVDVVHATEVAAEFPNATVFFPALGSDWRETARERHEADERNQYAYDFVTFERA